MAKLHKFSAGEALNATGVGGTWTVDSASVAANKVILCFFRSDSVNSDFSLNVTIKYHLT